MRFSFPSAKIWLKTETAKDMGTFFLTIDILLFGTKNRKGDMD